MPNFEQIKRYERVGSTDCGLFTIAYAVIDCLYFKWQ